MDQLLARSAYVGAVCDPSRVIHHFQAAFAFPTWIVGISITENDQRKWQQI
jgi:hypothetical protein